MRKQYCCWQTFLALMLSFVLMKSFVFSTLPMTRQEVVLAEEENTVFYFSNKNPTFSQEIVAGKYPDYEIKYISEDNGYALLLNYLDFSVEVDPIDGNDIVYIDFPWLSTKEAIELLEKLNGRCAQVYYISLREMNEYPTYEDEDGIVYSFAEYFDNYSENMEFYKVQTNEFYNFLVESARDIVSLFENDLDHMTFFFDRSMIGSFKDSWGEIKDWNGFANAAPYFYVFMKQLITAAGFPDDEPEIISDVLSMYHIEIYLHCEENYFVRLSQFLNDYCFDIESLYEYSQCVMDISSVDVERSIAVAQASVADENYKNYLLYSQGIYTFTSEMDAREMRPLIYLYTKDEIDNLLYVDQELLKATYEEEENKPEETLFDTISAGEVADFICDNFSGFVSEYNTAMGEQWQAIGIEGKYKIVVQENDEEKEAVFLDFNDAQGYAVVGENYRLYDLQTSGDSPFKGKSFKTCYYSVSAGYLYEKNSTLLSVDEANNADDSFLELETDGKHYNGQKNGATGCGQIDDTDQYIEDKYGSGWKKISKRRLSMKGYSQWKLSCYKENNIVNNKVVTSSEGNCWAVSAFTALQYMADQWEDMPQSSDNTVPYDPVTSEPNIYSLYFSTKDGSPQKKNTLLGTVNGQAVYKYSLKGNITFPALYTDVRKYINKEFKKIEGGSIWRSCWIINDVAEQYGHDVGYSTHVIWSAYVEKGTGEIDAGRPLLWSTSADTYGSHTMAVCGYVRYQKTKVFWRRFVIVKQKMFYEIKDGWTESSQYYDMSGYVGFAAIASFKYEVTK